MCPSADSPPNHSASEPPLDEPPRIVPGRPGRPSYSLEALRELVERQFADETAHRTDILSELDDAQKQRDALREVADYVLAVEAVTLAAADKRTLIEDARRNLFGLGPLERFLAQDDIAGIVVKDARTVFVERFQGGHLKRQAVDAAFDDAAHLASILERALAIAGVELSPDVPFVETGTVLHGRRARLTVVGPPLSLSYHVEIRLHPRAPLTLTADSGMLPVPVTNLLRRILNSGNGLLIIGEPGAGKTTLAGALVGALLESLPAADITTVERAAELALPRDAHRHTPAPTGDDPGRAFAEAILAALDDSPAWLVLDEVRGDEPAGLWAALQEPASRALLLLARGGLLPRVRSALSMAVRREHPALPQAAIDRALAARLPFVLALAVQAGQPHQLFEWAPNDPAHARVIARWQDAQSAEFPAEPLRPLTRHGGDYEPSH